MFCVASRPLAHPVCPASALGHFRSDAPAHAPAAGAAPAFTPAGAGGLKQGGSQLLSDPIYPQPQAVAPAGLFSASERRRIQAEADRHPLASSAAAIDPADLHPESAVRSASASASVSPNRRPVPRWPCEADEGWKELLGFDLTVLAPPRGHPIRKALPKAREDKDYPAFAMALRDMGVPARQIARAAVLAGLLPTQQRPVTEPEGGGTKTPALGDALRDAMNLYFKQIAEIRDGLPQVRAKLEAFLADHKTRMPQEDRARMEALLARLVGLARFG